MTVVGEVRHPVVILTTELKRILAMAMFRHGYRPFLIDAFSGDALVELGWLRREHSQRCDESSGLAWYDLTDVGEREVMTWTAP